MKSNISCIYLKFKSNLFLNHLPVQRYTSVEPTFQLQKQQVERLGGLNCMREKIKGVPHQPIVGLGLHQIRYTSSLILSEEE